MGHRIRPLVAVLILASACRDTKKPKAEPAKTDTTTPAAQPSPTTAKALDDGPRTIEEIELATIVRKGQDGETRTWKAKAGIEVSGADYKELYQSRDEHFVSFQSTIQGGPEDCLVYWKAELLKTKTGRGPSVAKLEGVLPVPAGRTEIASGVVNLSTSIAKSVGSANVGHWTLCGDALPSPSVFDFPITETEAKQIKYGKSFDLHHTRLAIEARPQKGKAQTRCYFELVAEDVDRDGFTLNRDFASFSMVPGTRSGALLRRTSFEGGNEADFADLALSKRSYLRKLACKPKPATNKSEIEGLRISNLALVPYEGEPTSAEEHVRQTFGQSATFENTMGKDCSFRIRYRILDKAGMPINRAPILSESIHLAKGARVDYRSKSQRLFVWKQQADEVGELIVEQAAPIRDCAAFDASKVLQEGDEPVSGGGDENQE